MKCAKQWNNVHIFVQHNNVHTAGWLADWLTMCVTFIVPFSTFRMAKIYLFSLNDKPGDMRAQLSGGWSKTKLP